MKKKSQKKIILGEPLIPHKSALNLYSKVIRENFPNEGSYARKFEKRISKLLDRKSVV